MENKTNEYYTIDVMHILKALWQRVWLIVLAGVIAAGVGFSIASFAITPTYSASVKLYVNNTSISVGGANFSISSSQIVAAQNLVKTYTEILNSHTTLDRVIDKTGVSYSADQLAGMIKAGPSNDTEIMKVTVTTTDPYEAAQIANCIAEVLPIRVSEIIDGASMEVVDSALPNLSKVAPSITKYTAIGMILGVLLMVAILAILAIMDDTIHDEDYILQNYNCPVLAKVPNLLHSGGKNYSNYNYYYQAKNKSNK